MRHWDVTDSEIRPVVPVPTPTEIAASLPSEAVQYDLTNPPLRRLGATRSRGSVTLTRD